MGQDPTPLLDEFRAWLAGRDEVPPVTATEPYHYSYDEDLDRFGRVVSERRGGEDIRTPLPGPVSTRDVDVAVLRAILDRHPQSPFTWEPGELTDAVQRYVERGTLGPDGLARIVPTIVPTLRAFLRFGAAEHPNASSDLGVLASEDDLDDAEVLVGLAMQLGGVEHPASARIARSRAIVTVDRYALEDFRLPLAVRPTVPTGIAQEGAATSAGLAVLRDVVGCVGRGRRVTDNGNLVLADVRRLADLLGVELPPRPAQSMLDVPAVAFAFRWAVAATFLARVNGRVVPGDAAPLLTTDPAGACLAALRGLTTVPTLLLPARRWRALPQDFAPRMLPALLAALYEFGEMPLAELDQLGWHRCTHTYDTAPLSDRANEFHRSCVAREVRHLCRRLALLGIVELDIDLDSDPDSDLDSPAARLTPLGTWALQQLLPEHGYRLPLTGGFDLPFHVLLDRLRDLPTEAVRGELAGWAEHYGADPAEELVRIVTR
ncbi:MAG TPA: hypothetical protein VKP64_13005, partial [Mycobacteriales bacterium]|nr:hypothetical protein [Mycobacteriales bacterium]